MGKVVAIDPHPEAVSDATSKFLITDRRDRPALFVILSSAAFPSSVADGATRTMEARSCLSPKTSLNVLLPLHVGYSDGASYSVYPYCNNLGRTRLVRAWNRRWLRQSLSEWLLAVCRETVVSPPSAKIEANFIAPLKAVVDHRLLSIDLRQTARMAISEIETGKWQPQHALAHNDLWEGNVLLPNQIGSTSPPSFVAIDWGGSKNSGYAIYDLARMAVSFRMPESQVTREIKRHSEALSCSPQQARNHLVAAIGGLALDLGYFPEGSFALMATEVMSLVNRCTSSID